MVADVVGCVLGGSQRHGGKVCSAVSGSLDKSGNKIQIKGVTHCCFLWGHNIFLCVAWPSYPKGSLVWSTLVLFGIYSVWGGRGQGMAWSFLCSSPNCVDSPAWGSCQHGEDLP